MLDDAPYFAWTNYSVPEHDPLPNSRLAMHLRDQIRPSSIVIILSGMYAAHSDWIQYEIEIAREMGKPILGIKPWGNQMIPVAVSSAAREIVGWNTNSIVEAIRRNAI
ncbi:MAG: TIR domain-containing protein [Methanomicrobiales archaeon]|nr:TIR domain-containing protein [Methanomicrobiales archaeon]